MRIPKVSQSNVLRSTSRPQQRPQRRCAGLRESPHFEREERETEGEEEARSMLERILDKSVLLDQVTVYISSIGYQNTIVFRCKQDLIYPRMNLRMRKMMSIWTFNSVVP